MKKTCVITILTIASSLSATEQVPDIVGKNAFAKWFSGDIRVREFNQPGSPMKVLSFKKGILTKISVQPIRIIPTGFDVSKVPRRIKAYDGVQCTPYQIELSGML